MADLLGGLDGEAAVFALAVGAGELEGALAASLWDLQLHLIRDVRRGLSLPVNIDLALVDEGVHQWLKGHFTGLIPWPDTSRHICRCSSLAIHHCNCFPLEYYLTQIATRGSHPLQRPQPAASPLPQTSSRSPSSKVSADWNEMWKVSVGMVEEGAGEGGKGTRCSLHNREEEESVSKQSS